MNAGATPGCADKNEAEALCLRSYYTKSGEEEFIFLFGYALHNQEQRRKDYGKLTHKLD